MSKVTELRNILENSFTNNDINIVGIIVKLQDLSFFNEIDSQAITKLFIIIIISWAWAML